MNAEIFCYHSSHRKCMYVWIAALQRNRHRPSETLYRLLGYWVNNCPGGGSESVGNDVSSMVKVPSPDILRILYYRPDRWLYFPLSTESMKPYKIYYCATMYLEKYVLLHVLHNASIIWNITSLCSVFLYFYCKPNHTDSWHSSAPAGLHIENSSRTISKTQSTENTLTLL